MDIKKITAQYQEGLKDASRNSTGTGASASFSKEATRALERSTQELKKSIKPKSTLPETSKAEHRQNTATSAAPLLQLPTFKPLEVPHGFTKKIQSSNLNATNAQKALDTIQSVGPSINEDLTVIGLKDIQKNSPSIGASTMESKEPTDKVFSTEHIGINAYKKVQNLIADTSEKKAQNFNIKLD